MRPLLRASKAMAGVLPAWGRSARPWHAAQVCWSSLYTLTFLGFLPFGNLVLGALAEWIGLNAAITLAAVLTFASAVVVFWRIPHLRHLP